MLEARLDAALDRRLERDLDRPVAIALSGGGDSMALLHLSADWARRRGRRLLALTVDHKLNSESVAWSEQAESAARRLGVDWRGLSWIGPKPTTGLSAAARTARHRLIANAARDAGTGIVLMAHTADDRAEAAWMRDHGSSVGSPKAWGPSPAWPEGRDLMLMRPLLDVPRADLRDVLRTRGEGWIDDPANDRAGSLRADARRALAGRQPEPVSEPETLAVDFQIVHGVALAPIRTPWLGALLTCLSGQAAPPRTDRLDALRNRLGTGRLMRATLHGVTVVSDGEMAMMAREPGRNPPLMSGVSDEASVWDGRVEVRATEPGWRVGPAEGHLGRLSSQDRAWINTLPAFARDAHPVLFRDGDPRPVLAHEAVTMRDLVPDRLRLATGGAQRESDL